MLRGRLDYPLLRSAVLRGNPLSDPTEREVLVYLPPSYDETKPRRYPLIVILPAYAASHRTLASFKLWEKNVFELYEQLLARAECTEAILRHANHIASTSGLIEYAKKSPKQKFIVATEEGIMHKMQQAAPGKTLIPAPPEDESCSCNKCPFMRKNTLEKLYLCLRDLQPQVDVPEAVRVKALKPIQRMLEMSA